MAVDKLKSNVCTTATPLAPGANAKTGAPANSLTRENLHYGRGETLYESSVDRDLLLGLVQ